ncbi:hypothetical protein GQ457_08G013310 [Hibiscus cannabinus]
MDVKPCLLVFLVINAVTLSELHLAVQAAESEPVSPSDSIRFRDFSNELKVSSRRSRRLSPPPPRINPPIHFKSPPPSPRPPPPPPRSPPPPCQWEPPPGF